VCPCPPIHLPLVQAFLTPSHLGIVLESVAGGELLDAVAASGRLPEDVARYFFQQLIVGLEYCHSNVRWGGGTFWAVGQGPGFRGMQNMTCGPYLTAINRDPHFTCELP
jgi:serine/threonine protein kinase